MPTAARMATLLKDLSQPKVHGPERRSFKAKIFQRSNAQRQRISCFNQSVKGFYPEVVEKHRKSLSKDSASESIIRTIGTNIQKSDSKRTLHNSNMRKSIKKSIIKSKDNEESTNFAKEDELDP